MLSSVELLGTITHCQSFSWRVIVILSRGSRSPWCNGINSAVTSPQLHVSVNISSWPGVPFIPICIQADTTTAPT